MRVDGVGDALACTPLIAALRSAGHTLGALLASGNAEIFARNVFERVHVVERIPWPKHGYTAHTWDSALRDASNARYDVALIPSEEPQAYTFARAAGIPERAGFHNGWQKPLKSFWARRQLTHAVYRSAVLPRHPDAEPHTLFRLGTGLHGESEPTREVQRLRPLVVGEDHSEKHVEIAVQLTAKWIGGDRTVRDVAQWLRALYDRRPAIIIASESERASLREIAAQADFPVTYFSDQQSWKGAIARAALLVTPDTGAAHVAGMVGTPVVDVFEEKDFARNAARWTPWAAPARILSFAEARREEGMAMRLIRAAESLVPGPVA